MSVPRPYEHRARQSVLLVLPELPELTELAELLDVFDREPEPLWHAGVTALKMLAMVASL